MTDPKITCPSCSAEIALTESLAGPLLAQTRREAAARQQAALADQKAAIEAAATQAAEAAQAARLAEIQEAAQAREAEVAALQSRAKAQEAKLAEAQKAQAAALAREALLAEREREMDLTIQKQVAAQTEAARQKLRVQAEALAAERLAAEQEKAQLILAEKDQKLLGLTRQIEVLQRKLEQGSQQQQGEAAEVVLEHHLARAFPMDSVEEVPKGIRGADCLLRVGMAGTILWESKRTANWSAAWLPKLRDDMRAAGADLCVLVSDVRPDGVETFAHLDGVWVAAPRYAVPLAHVLRDGLMRVAEARGVREGQATKTEMLYDYLTDGRFRARLEAAVEPFRALEEALAKEKRHMTAQWAAREKQLEKAQIAMAGMYGDIRGIAGGAVAQIEAFEPDLLDGA
ncbi:hypothetical protein JANAI62_15390 [Jannaschia pagri]|uniref:DUF2130 domain-containing protein n=1 Tax=Jannaschia pagri TaxID=2829797 RepID=A0ABQ4NKI8_9RHOB|nr:MULTISPECIES: DUF2130 domain-containing protein [unclassified Jannaschia]GIT91084.1 hypothetical protein JANAI61_15420 [Jannaschia sp. AI_61]GIT94916.1 hypothetical protein JANAI62_15390 [Jannaschia sp. AI_62]